MNKANPVDPFVVLKGEHELLFGVLDSLECCIAAVDRGSDPRDLRRFVEFLRGFLSAWHWPKEDDILFRAMARSGFLADSGPLAVLDEDHREIERLLAKAAAYTANGGPAGGDALRFTLRVLRSLDALIRYHLEMEETVLFETAERELSDVAIAEIGDSMQVFLDEARGSFRYHSLRRMADRLQSDFLPANRRRVALAGSAAASL